MHCSLTVPSFNAFYIRVYCFIGGEFLLNHVKVKNELRCYFAVTEDGCPIKLQRKPYTECFYTIGLYELYRATSDIKYQVWSMHVCIDSLKLEIFIKTGLIRKESNIDLILFA